MKKAVQFLLSLVVLNSFSISVFAQKYINNSDRPVKEKFGKLIKLKEKMRITDNGKDAIFFGPYDIKIDKDGGIYFCDNFQIYKFDDTGKRLFKIIEKGQGPGESGMRTTYMITESEIIVQSKAPSKIMQFTLNGKLKHERLIQTTNLFEFIGYVNNKIYGIYEDIPYGATNREGFVNFPMSLCEISYDFQNIKKIFSFPLQYYVLPGAWWQRARFDYVFHDNKILFVVHTSEYQILIFNIEKNKIDTIFKRKYKRIKVPSRNRKEDSSGKLSPPPLRYYHDIQKIILYNGQLWAITSTMKDYQNYLVDVYNMEGIYVDNFYLQFPKGQNPRRFSLGTIAIKGDYVYTIDEDKEGNFSITKYEIPFD